MLSPTSAPDALLGLVRLNRATRTAPDSIGALLRVKAAALCSLPQSNDCVLIVCECRRQLVAGSVAGRDS